MSMETETLEHKAEHHRARVDSSLDELRDRLSVGQILDEVWGQVRHGQGGDMAKNLGRQVRDNPLALSLIGAGVAWLLTGDNVRAEAREMKRRYDTWNEDPASSYGSRSPSWPHERHASAPPRSSDYGTGMGPRGKLDSSSDSLGQSEPGLLAKTKTSASSLAGGAADAAGRAGDAIADAAGGVADATSRVGQSVSDAAAAARDNVRQYGAEVSDAAHFAAEEAGRYGRYFRRDLYARGDRLRRSFLDTLYEEPLIIGGVALAVGAAIGVSLPATRREDQMFGSARDDLRDAAYAYGEDVADKVGLVANKAYEAASDEAEKKGLLPEGDRGETIAEKAGDVVKAAVDKAKIEAAKNDLT